MLRILLLLVIFSACSSSIVGKVTVGDCLKHKWEAGDWLVKKISDDQVILQEIVTDGASIGKIKVVGKYYGGFNKISCPQVKDPLAREN